jgi:hypothetical protein
LLIAAELRERQLLDVGQQTVEPTAGLLDVVAAVRVGRVGRPPEAPGSGRKPPGRLFKVASASCLRLFWHCAIRAASRAAWTAGSSRAIKMPMIVMTTKSSTSVKPEERDVRLTLAPPRRNDLVSIGFG